MRIQTWPSDNCNLLSSSERQVHLPHAPLPTCWHQPQKMARSALQQDPARPSPPLCRKSSHQTCAGSPVGLLGTAFLHLPWVWRGITAHIRLGLLARCHHTQHRPNGIAAGDSVSSTWRLDGGSTAHACTCMQARRRQAAPEPSALQPASPLVPDFAGQRRTLVALIQQEHVHLRRAGSGWDNEV